MGWLFAIAALAAGMQPPAAPAGEPPALHAPDAIDHVLLWSGDADKATATLAVRMGFQVRAGGSFPDGVANRIVRFPDRSYLELLYFTRPGQELKGDALEAYRFTTDSGGGANSFALAADNIDATQAYLKSRGFDVETPDPPTYDPDGDGPGQPLALWRTVTFGARPLASSSLFFIQYNRRPRSPERAADEAVFAQHPNGALGISAIWLLSADVQADRETLQKMGLRGRPVSLPHLGASGLRFDTAREAIILLQPEGDGAAAKAVAARGPHIYGVSVAVKDLGRAQRIVERGFGERLERHRGPLGEAIIAPSQQDLGLAIEFHQSQL